jgi:hypothetical protein
MERKEINRGKEKGRKKKRQRGRLKKVGWKERKTNERIINK